MVIGSISNLNTHWHDDNGNLALGYRLYFFESQTNTPAPTYKDQGGQAQHTFPIIVQPNGKVPGGGLFFSSDYTYRLEVRTDLDVPVETTDFLQVVEKGEKGDKGDTGPVGEPGKIQSVTSSDSKIVVDDTDENNLVLSTDDVASQTDLNVVAAQVTTNTNTITSVSNDLVDHIDDENNPHQVTNAQVGLSNVLNQRSMISHRWYEDEKGTLTYDKTTRTITSSGSRAFDFQGVRVEKTSSDSLQLPIPSSGIDSFYVVYDSNYNLTYITDFDYDDLLLNNVYVARISILSTGETVFYGEQRHTNTVDAKYIEQEDKRITSNVSGPKSFSLSSITPDQSGDDDSDAQYLVDSGTFLDGDLTNGVVQSGLERNVFYIGAGGVVMPVPAANRISGFSLVNAPSGRLMWNDTTTGTLVEVTNNDFVLMHEFVYKSIGGHEDNITLVGQADYNTLTQAQEGATVEMIGVIEAFITGMGGDAVPVSSTIFQTLNNYTNQPLARVRSTNNGDAYISWTGGVTGTGGGIGGNVDSVNGLVGDVNLTIDGDSSDGNGNFDLTDTPKRITRYSDIGKLEASTLEVDGNVRNLIDRNPTNNIVTSGITDSTSNIILGSYLNVNEVKFQNIILAHISDIDKADYSILLGSENLQLYGNSSNPSLTRLYKNHIIGSNTYVFDAKQTYQIGEFNETNSDHTFQIGENNVVDIDNPDFDDKNTQIGHYNQITGNSEFVNISGRNNGVANSRFITNDGFLNNINDSESSQGYGNQCTLVNSNSTSVFGNTQHVSNSSLVNSFGLSNTTVDGFDQTVVGRRLVVDGTTQKAGLILGNDELTGDQKGTQLRGILFDHEGNQNDGTKVLGTDETGIVKWVEGGSGGGSSTGFRSIWSGYKQYQTPIYPASETLVDIIPSEGFGLSEDYDIGDVYDTSTGLFTTPQDGIYSINLMMQVDRSIAGNINYFGDFRAYIRNASTGAVLSSSYMQTALETSEGINPIVTVNLATKLYLTSGTTLKPTVGIQRVSNSDVNVTIPVGIRAMDFSIANQSSSGGSGGGQVDEVIGVGNIKVDSATDPTKPIVSTIDGYRFGLRVTPEYDEEGYFFYDSDDDTLTLQDGVGTQYPGKSLVVRARNQSGATIPAGKLVYFDDSASSLFNFKLAIATSKPTATYVGFTQRETQSVTDIDAISNIVTEGIIEGIDTTSFSEGDILYLSAINPGEFTNISPVFPNFEVKVGKVLTVGANGKIHVGVDTDPQFGGTTNTVNQGIQTYDVSLITDALPVNVNVGQQAMYFNTGIIPNANTSITKLSCFVTQGGNNGGMRMGIYNTNSELVGQTVFDSNNLVNGIKTLNLTSQINLMANTLYYLAIQISSNGVALGYRPEGYNSNSPILARYDQQNAPVPTSTMVATAGYSQTSTRIWIAGS